MKLKYKGDEDVDNIGMILICLMVFGTVILGALLKIILMV